MKYRSTRGKADELDFEGAVLAGLARDGGLYVPTSWPQFSADDIAGLAGKSYAEVAYTIIHPFVSECISDDELRTITREVYGDAFTHKAVAPLRQIDSNHWILELYHGPTLAFKDFALQLLGRLFDLFTERHGNQITILGATSGDTGSAAIEATRGREHVKIFMLHPEGKVSDVQRRQMTTVLEPNVINMAVDGNFDDCQALVKECFNDLTFRDDVNLTAVNSINWARVMAQIVYYFTAAVSLGAPRRTINFCVPTGNFGDIFAGYVAKNMGLSIGKLIVATNSNDILARALTTGRYERGTVSATISPSMDIQVSSNFERLVFDLVGCDGARVQALMDQFASEGYFQLTADELAKARTTFDAACINDDDTKAIMARVLKSSGQVIDPHTAVGVGAAELLLANETDPIVTLSTAHPVKFGDAVFEATGLTPELPTHMADLFDRDEGYAAVPNDGDSLRKLIRETIS